jgi:hypothetical protein
MANAQDLAELGLTENDYNTYLMENFGRDINGNYIVPPAGSSGGGSSSGGSGRRSSGRSYGSGGNNSGGGSISDYAPYSDGWYEEIRQAAVSSGVTPAQYIRTNYKTTLGLGNKDNMEEALKGEAAYQEKFQTAQKQYQAQKQAAMKTAGTKNTTNKGASTSATKDNHSNKTAINNAIYNLNERGLISDATAEKLFRP